MPRIVDHEARRQEIVASYLALLEHQRIGLASSRSLAAQLGISNSLLWRYFKDMNELITQAYRTVVQNVDDRIMFAIAGRRGLEAARRMITELLPLNGVSQAEARLVVAFWGLEVTRGTAIADGLTEQEAWRSVLERLLNEAAQRQGSPELNAGDLARIIMNMSMHAQIEYSINGNGDAARQTAALIDRMLAAHYSR